MKQEDIQIGDTLILKRERAEAYGCQAPVKVTAIRATPGRKTEWIYSGAEAYRASDFSGKAADVREQPYAIYDSKGGRHEMTCLSAGKKS